MNAKTDETKTPKEIKCTCGNPLGMPQYVASPNAYRWSCGMCGATHWRQNADGTNDVSDLDVLKVLVNMMYEHMGRTAQDFGGEPWPPFGDKFSATKQEMKDISRLGVK